MENTAAGLSMRSRLSRVIHVAGWIWGGAVLCAFLFAAWLMIFRPAESEFSTLYVWLLGLPWSPWIAHCIRPGNSTIADLFNLGILSLGGLLNAGILLGSAAICSGRRESGTVEQLTR